MALYLFWLLCLLSFVSEIKGKSGTSGTRLCSSYAELYYANVAGRIRGGVDVIEVTDQTLCSKRSFVDLRYRQIDGRCNHPKDYGSTFKAVKRYLRPHYQDRQGYNNPRIYSVRGDFLPSPRLISWKLHPDEPVTDSHTVFLMQMGQFIDHDITSAPVPTETNSSIKCCGVPKDQLSKECFPIPVTDDDPIFKKCMEFVRSEPVHDENDEIIYPREQMNALTSFVDGSAVYGNDMHTLNMLRSENGKGAYLNVRLVHGKERLPVNPDAPEDSCIVSHHPDSYCQLAGDKRVDEQPGLGSIHLMFHLHHNHIVRLLVAGVLKKRGEIATPAHVEKFVKDAPVYIKEKLFQEAKKIASAVIQKITYCDWLPMILGPALIQKFKLGCDRRSRYNPYVDPRIANAFLSAAFRFGHTMIPNKLQINYRKVDLKDTFMIPDHNLRHYDSILEGLLEDGSTEGFDRFISKSVTQHLFESARGPTGALDLVALNIQRGRDHGIPSYYYFRRYYGLKRFTRLDQFGEAGESIKKIYRHILDADLFVGGLLEPSVKGGLVGETFGHIIAHQFADLKYGDAHFFLSKEVPQGFTFEQVEALKKTSLNNVICANSEVQSVQENPFLVASDSNPLRPCSDYLDLDVTPWLIYY